MTADALAAALAAAAVGRAPPPDLREVPATALGRCGSPVRGGPPTTCVLRDAYVMNGEWYVVHEDGVRLLRGLPAQNLMDGSSNVTRDLVADRLNILFNPNDRLGCRQNMVSCCIRAFYTPHPARNSDQYSIRYQLYGAVVTQ